jgi:hypothetical protein
MAVLSAKRMTKRTGKRPLEGWNPLLPLSFALSWESWWRRLLRNSMSRKMPPMGTRDRDKDRNF